MSDLRPLRDEGADAFERAMLASAEEDAAPADLERRVLGAMSAAGAAAGAGRAGLLHGSVWKWIGVALVCGAAFVAFWATTRTRSSAPSVPAPGAAEPAATAVVAASATPSIEEPAAASEPAAAPSPSAAKTKLTASASPSSSAGGIGDEVRMLDEARGLLKAGDATGAIAALDRYQAKFPHGILGPEALVVRVEALMRKGDRAAATTLAHRFLAAHPNGFHASRLRDLIGETRAP